MLSAAACEPLRLVGAQFSSFSPSCGQEVDTDTRNNTLQDLIDLLGSNMPQTFNQWCPAVGPAASCTLCSLCTPPWPPSSVPAGLCCVYNPDWKPSWFHFRAQQPAPGPQRAMSHRVGGVVRVSGCEKSSLWFYFYFRICFRCLKFPRGCFLMLVSVCVLLAPPSGQYSTLTQHVVLTAVTVWFQCKYVNTEPGCSHMLLWPFI